ncbi:GNAT family N-acetyltransferase [Streptococcus suis]|uniref:GNAT family N-acetyltransferase n=1 Tax=Streptococcus suis TaxID=1307 RepID=UPI0015548037|nr:GNAT family N-acetyltransferase [Streptococcus suis]MBY5032751.1 GNAT family N-acetyltransferase [Streptococcus suis]MBY5037265.1 GNAT family N-acetyltransferase [Streptococcus suis]MCK3894690.1 GNAT family N-acetyltransferase [Streptococcus suis]NQO83111.1 GNAT family N-acetyltransferase [Streptococcus suis]HEM5503950.1 GNAT family N-acetyltransferase [Streptococcus suis]
MRKENKKIRISELSEEELLNNKEKISDWLLDSFIINFPNKKINKNFRIERFGELLSYIKSNQGYVIGAWDEAQNSLNGILWYFFTIDNHLHINEIVISSEYRSKGIGKALFQHVNNLAIDKNITALELNVMADNIIALNFYQNQNFEPKKIFMVKKINEDIE